jgi:hypothetical protein
VTAQANLNAHQQPRPRITRVRKDIGGEEWQPDPPDLEEWFAELERLRDARDTELARVQEARRRRDELLAAQRSVEEEWADLERRLPGLRATLQEAERQVTSLSDSAQEYRVARDAATARLLGGVGTGHPLVLLPVRLETRFVNNSGDIPHLLVRIYPDDLHADSHEPELTADEKVWGSHFRRQTAAADSEPAAEREPVRQRAWEQLAERFGPQRAAWIARRLDTAPPESIPGRESAWTRAPRTNVLPDRWVALAYPRDGGLPVVAWGEQITDPLVLGPAPRSGAGGPLPGVDEEMRWMVDFDAALAKGMALRIPLSGAGATEGFERLVVVGVRSGLDASSSAGRLASLFDAHHYTSGLALIPQNTPTNNTEEVSSGYRPDGGEARDDWGYRVERGPSLVIPSGDGAILTRALGLDASVFGHVLNADGREQAAAAAMNRALWPATGAWWLSQAATGDSPGDVDGGRSVAWRDHFANFVRGRGPLPAFRVGNQPYGVLPITSLERWQPPVAGVSTPSGIGDALRAVLHAWDRARSQVVTLGRRGSGVEGGRPLPSRHADMSQRELLPIVLGQEATSCGYRLRRFADGARFAEPSVALARDPASPNPDFALRPPEPNYLRLLRENPNWNLGNAPRPHPLLYLLLRRAAPIALGSGADAAGAAAFRSALTELESLPDRALRVLMSETLDACSYRLDAWITSLATSRLERLRASDPSPRGIRLGGYGWVEDLRPEPALRRASDPVPGEPAPVFVSQASGGFVQAPSLTQASTAAVLRSGYLSEKRAGGSGEALAVDLSSARVRQAEWLLEGVRQGQSLGALLGYRFERGLHESRLDHHIDRFRTLAALREEDELAAAYQRVRQALQQEASVAAEVSRLRAGAQAAEQEVRKEEALIHDLQQRRAGPAGEVARIEGYASEAQSARTTATQLDREILSLRLQRPRTRIAKLANGEDYDYAGPDEFLAWQEQLDALGDRHREALARVQQLDGQYAAEAGALAAARKEIEAIDALRREAEGRMRAQVEAKRRWENEANARQAEQNGRAAELTEARAALSTVLERRWGEALESLAAANVVDGLELHRRFRLGLQSGVWDGTTIPFGLADLGFPAPGHAEHEALLTQLRALGEAVDAVGDVAVAEGVHQLVQGNTLRSGATLDAISRSEVPPPELEVVRTPRTGVALTHRVLALFGTDVAQAHGWDAGVASARAEAEPLLNGWVATLLPDPARVRCGASYVDRSTGAVIDTTEISLGDLGLAPLDVVFLAEGDEEAQMGELEQRLIYLLLRRYAQGRGGADPAPSDVDVRLTFTRETGDETDQVSFAELLEVARTARKLVAGARPLRPDDLSSPGALAETEAFQVDGEELARRARNAEKKLRETHELLLRAAGPEGTIGQLQTALLAAARFGVAGAIPLYPFDFDEEAYASAEARAQEVRERFEAATEQAQLLPSIQAEAQAAQNEAERLVARLAELQRRPRTPRRTIEAARRARDAAVARAQEARERLEAATEQAQLLPSIQAEAEAAEREVEELRVAPQDEATLREQAASVAREVERRRGQLDGPSAELRPDDPGRMAAIFGADFRVLPRLAPRPGAPTELGKAFDRGGSFLGSDPLAPVAWLQRAARVRAGVSRLDASLLYAEAIGGRARLTSLSVGQLPYEQTDRWVALEQDQGRPIPAGRLSLVVHLPRVSERPRFDGPVSGLLIDEWVEVVPNRSETTGLTFHFDQPDARTPQSILLAVAPDDRRPVWDLDTLAAVLCETLDLAHMRAVDPVALRSAVTAALHRLLNPTNGDHYYTVSESERDNAVANFGYRYEGIACHAFTSQDAGATPLHRLLNPTNGDHFYAVSESERDNAVANFGYRYEGVECYVFGDAGPSLPPAVWFAEPNISEPAQSDLARAAP